MLLLRAGLSLRPCSAIGQRLSFALIQDISRRRPRPTCSTMWFRSRRRMALNAGALTLVLQHPLAGELPSWISCQDLLHLGLGFVGDDPRAAGVVAVFGRVRDAVAHVVQAALVEQVDDQLQLVHALEVGHLGLVAGLDERFEAGLHQRADAAAEHDLLAEQVGLGLFGEGGFDDAARGCRRCPWRRPGRCSRASSPAPSPRAIRQGTPPPRGELAAHQVAGPLRRDQQRVDALGRFDLAEVDVEAVRAHQRRCRA